MTYNMSSGTLNLCSLTIIFVFYATLHTICRFYVVGGSETTALGVKPVLSLVCASSAKSRVDIMQDFYQLLGLACLSYYTYM